MVRVRTQCRQRPASVTFDSVTRLRFCLPSECLNESLSEHAECAAGTTRCHVTTERRHARLSTVDPGARPPRCPVAIVECRPDQSTVD
jgi:hypothetical protein